MNQHDTHARATPAATGGSAILGWLIEGFAGVAYSYGRAQTRAEDGGEPPRGQPASPVARRAPAGSM